jgi:dTDP-glucose 4,6-dehydratase
MRSILVTGGAGFIGSHYLHHLLAAHPDYRAVVLDKLTYAGKKERLCAVANAAPGRLEFVENDLAQEGFAQWLLDEYHCDVIIHFAAESHVERSVEEPMLFWKTNADGSVHLLEAARHQRVKRFLYVSSVEVYGPQAEQANLWREDAMIDPPTPYAGAKAAAEHWASVYWKSYGLPTIITRCSNNYGPRQHAEKQLPAFITAALRGDPLLVHGDGAHRRQWLYVEDHCRALDLILHADEKLVAGEIFNIGGSQLEERTTLQNAQAVLERLSSHSQIIFTADRVPSIRRLALDSSKLEQRLGWQPRVSFDEGLDRTLSYYKGEHQKTLSEGAGDRSLTAAAS